MIRLKDYFDRVYILTYTGSDYRRKLNAIIMQWQELFEEPFEAPFVDIKYSFNSVMFRDLYDSYREKNPMLTNVDDHGINITMWHYFMLKEAYHLGLERILILEDDVLFLKDAEKIKNTLDHMPDDYKICQLHKGYISNGMWLRSKLKRGIEGSKINEWFYDGGKFKRIIGTDFVHISSACNAFTREGMKAAIDIFDNWSRFDCKDVKPNGWLVCDTYYPMIDSGYYVAVDDIALAGNGTGKTDRKFSWSNLQEKDYHIELLY